MLIVVNGYIQLKTRPVEVLQQLESSATVVSLHQHIGLIEMNEDGAFFDVVPLSVSM